jgi:hypothetical protein
VQVLGDGNRRVGVVRQQRRDFQRNPTVHAAGSVMNRPEQVRRLREVVQREFEEEFFFGLAFCELAFDGVVVVATVLDRVVEDRRIRCQPGDRNSSI